MDYTCENCKYRYTWDCSEYWTKNCEDFELDESTLSVEEQMMPRVMRQVAKENGK